jgi:uncharacterized membrane protein YqaE (UPF0057 family)
MKNLRKYAMLGLAFTIITASCTIEKRSHMNGYHVTWKNGKNKISNDVVQLEDQELNQSEVAQTIDIKLQEAEATDQNSSLAKSTEKLTIIASATEQTSSENEVIKSKSDEKNDIENHLETLPVNESKDFTKNVKLNLEKLFNSGTTSTGSDTDTLILIIVALFIPPLAIGLFEGLSTRFWISLILFLLTIGTFAGIGLGLGGLVALINVIWAILIVAGLI